jgi:signal peptidase I
MDLPDLWCDTTTPMSNKHFKAVEVRGKSMLPTFNEGDWLLFKLILSNPDNSKKIPLRLGQVVLIRRASEAGSDFLQIKRITIIEPQSSESSNPKIWVEGDNKSDSSDSRSWGSISQAEVVGKLIFRYRKAAKNKLAKT